MILHTVPGSPNGRRVEAVIAHLGLQVEIRHYDLFKGELKLPNYLALNANAKAPTLQDGDFLLWETTAIMQYLCEKSGDTDLFPRNPRIRADIARWQCWEGLYFNAALSTLAFETIAKARRNIGPDASQIEQAKLTLDRFAPVLEAHLKGRKYMVGVLHFSELKNKTWWKENNTSLIVMPGAVIEDIDIRDVKKKSLELAGIV